METCKTCKWWQNNPQASGQWGVCGYPLPSWINAGCPDMLDDDGENCPTHTSHEPKGDDDE